MTTREDFFAGKGRGHKADPPEVRARMAGFHLLKARRGLSAAALPLSTNNRQFLQVSAGGPGIRDQKQVGACEGYANTSGITLRYALMGTPIPLMSAIGAYQCALMIQGSFVQGSNTLSDDGTEPNILLQGIQTFGGCSVATWGNEPATPDSVIVQPDLARLEKAATFPLRGAYAIASTGDQYLTDLMIALAAKYPVTGAIAASSSTFNNYTGGVLTAMDNNVDHATLWLDYSWDGKNLSSLILFGANSWGDGLEGDPPWGESDAPGIAAGMYRGDYAFANAYNGSSFVIDVAPVATGEVES